MATEPSSQATELSPPGDQPPPPISRRVNAVIVGWFLGWPFVAYACLPSEPPISSLGAWLLGAGSFLWFLSCFGIYGLLFVMIEARWPAARKIRQIVEFIFGILRVFQGHNSS
jgi:hypothetical protein